MHDFEAEREDMEADLEIQNEIKLMKSKSLMD